MMYYQYNSTNDLYLSVVPLGVDLGDEFTSACFNFMTPMDNSLWLYDGFTEGEKYLFLSGQITTNSNGEAKDWSQITSCGPFNLAPQESVVIAFAVVGGEDLGEFQTHTISAMEKYLSITTNIENEDDNDNLPDDFCLDQNYPNPFNPSTIITFELRRENEELRTPHPTERIDRFFSRSMQKTLTIPTSLKIYNIKGQLVKTLFEDELPEGRYEIVWDGKDESGAEVASGAYLYRLKTEQGAVSRKMILLK
jgi:hypothetical protein